MQKYVVEPLRPDRRDRPTIVGVFADADGPLAHAAGAAHHGQFQRLRNWRGGGKKIRYRLQTQAGRRTHQRNRSAQLARQRQNIDRAVLLVQFVRHIQQHQRRQAERNHARGEHEVRIQVVGVQDDDDRVGTRHSGHVALQHLDRNPLVFRLGNEAVDAGQVDERDFFAVGIANVADVVLDGDTGKIADFLAQSGEPIVERGLAGIRRTDNRNGAIGGCDRFVLRARHGMARHGRVSLRSITEGRCADQGHVDVPGELAAYGHFRPFDPIDPGIASRAAAFNGDFETGNKSQVHQVFGDRMVQLEVLHDGAFAYLQIGQRTAVRSAALLASEYEVENHFQFQLYSNPFPTN